MGHGLGQGPCTRSAAIFTSTPSAILAFWNTPLAFDSRCVQLAGNNPAINALSGDTESDCEYSRADEVRALSHFLPPAGVQISQNEAHRYLQFGQLQLNHPTYLVDSRNNLVRQHASQVLSFVANQRQVARHRNPELPPLDRIEEIK